MESESQTNVSDFSNIKPVLNKGIDLSKHQNKQVQVEKVEVTTVPSKFTPKLKDAQGNELEQHLPQWVLKVSSGVLETIGEGDDKVEFRASELFNLTQDENGQLNGFPAGEGSNLYKFLTDIGIKVQELESLKQVIENISGKNAVVKAYSKEVDGNEKTYLKFKY